MTLDAFCTILILVIVPLLSFVSLILFTSFAWLCLPLSLSLSLSLSGSFTPLHCSLPFLLLDNHYSIVGKSFHHRVGRKTTHRPKMMRRRERMIHFHQAGKWEEMIKVVSSMSTTRQEQHSGKDQLRMYSFVWTPLDVLVHTHTYTYMHTISWPCFFLQSLICSWISKSVLTFIKIWGIRNHLQFTDLCHTEKLVATEPSKWMAKTMFIRDMRWSATLIDRQCLTH